LLLEFAGSRRGFSLPYLICFLGGDECQLKTINLDGDKKGSLIIPEFSRQYSAITLMPYIKGKESGFDGRENTYAYSLKVTVAQKPDNSQTNNQQNETQEEAALLAKIAALKKRLRGYKPCLRQNQPAAVSVSCASIDTDLYFGIMGDDRVRCLQEF